MAGCVATAQKSLYRPECYRGAVPDYTPVGDPKWGYYDGFDLVVENTGTKDIELNWNRTLYLKNGQTNGGFMYEGIVYAQRNDPKPPDLIFAGTRLRKRIYPNVLVDLFKGHKKTEWINGMLRPGTHGVSLSLWIDGKEVRQAVGTKVVQLPK